MNIRFEYTLEQLFSGGQRGKEGRGRRVPSSPSHVQQLAKTRFIRGRDREEEEERERDGQHPE